MTVADERRLARLEELAAQAALDASAHPKTKRATPLAFIESLKIVDKESGRIVAFRLWKAQKQMLRTMVANDRLVLVKARQLGVSWLALAYMLYLATFEPGQLFVVARQSLEEAGEAIHRLCVMNLSAPAEWRQEMLTDNVNSLAFANGSRIRALSSTKRIGRGLSARYMIADELAFWDAPEEQLAALDPGAQRLHVISTGNGQDFFRRLYLEALTGKGRWSPAFYPWTAHPGRDAAWYERSVTLSPSPALAKREYATTPEDAFSSPAGAYWERWDTSRNVADLVVVPEWRTVRAVDYGYRMSACVWAQQSPTGQLFIVSELLPTNTTTQEFASKILARDRDRELGAGRSARSATRQAARPTSRPRSARSRSSARWACVR